MTPAIINLILALIALEPKIEEYIKLQQLKNDITDEQLAEMKASSHASVARFAAELEARRRLEAEQS